MAKRRAEYQVQLELQRDQQKMAQKEKMAEESRARDEESIQRQEKLRRDTLEYEYQLKASLEQQKLGQEKRMREEQLQRELEMKKDYNSSMEREKRETNKQQIIAGVNAVGSQLGQAFNSPKSLAKVAYYSLLVFGSYHLSKHSIGLLSQTVQSFFGKPQLVRETSKIYTNNYAMIPFIWGRKFINNNIVRHSESNLLKGVILDKKLEE